MFGWLKNLMGGAQKTARPPILVGPLAEPDLRLALERPCAPLIFAKPANIDPLETMFGAVRLGQRAEAWPAHKGTPMWPLCQINLTQAPFVPEALRDLAVITVFISPDHMTAPMQICDTRRPDEAATWALRSYETLENLRIPRAPAHASPLVPQRGVWAEVKQDYANHELAGQVIDTDANDVYAYDWCRSVTQTKLGGWPATVQSEPWWDYAPTGDTWDFVMQIENEPQAGWQGWGNGAAFIARSRQRPHLWAMEVQAT
jgi:hypothetical protein